MTVKSGKPDGSPHYCIALETGAVWVVFEQRSKHRHGLRFHQVRPAGDPDGLRFFTEGAGITLGRTAYRPFISNKTDTEGDPLASGIMDAVLSLMGQIG